MRALLSCFFGFLIVGFAFLIPDSILLHFDLINQAKFIFLQYLIRVISPFFSFIFSLFSLYTLFITWHKYKYKYIFAFLGAVIYFFLGLLWLNDSMYVHMNFALVISLLGCLLFAVYNALFFVLAIFLSKKMYMFPFFWVLSEWLRGSIFTGFSWLNFTYAFIDTPLIFFASYFGIYGMQFILACFAIVCIYAIKIQAKTTKPKTIIYVNRFLCCIFCITLLGFYHYYQSYAKQQELQMFSKNKQKLNVRIIQANISQDRKFNQEALNNIIDTNQFLMFRKNNDLLNTNINMDLIITSETAFPLLINNLPNAVYNNMLEYNKNFNTAILFGAADEPMPSIYANALFFMPNYSNKQYQKSSQQHKNKEVTINYQSYYKHHLVPFGEFIPFGFDWILKRLNIPMGNFMRGDLVQNNFYVHKYGQIIPFSANICYELLFGNEMAAVDRINQPQFFVNSTNLAWFGHSALIQFLNIGRMRAIELNKSILIANNSGVSSLILPNGVVKAYLLPNTVDVLDVYIPVNKTSGTFYSYYGDKPILYLIGFFVLYILFAYIYRHIKK